MPISNSSLHFLNDSGVLTIPSKTIRLPVEDMGVGTSNARNLKQGILYKACITCPASSGNYSAIQLWNPVGSGKVLMINVATGFQNVATAGRYYRHFGTTQLANTQSGAIQKTSTSQANSVAVCQYENIAALTANTNQHGMSSASTTPTGAGLLNSTEGIAILAGEGARFEFQNTNTQINLTIMYVEMNSSDFAV